MNTTELPDINSTLIKNIHDFLKTGEQQIEYSPNKDIVLLLGNTGSGKSTLTQFISGNAHKLLSQEVEEGTGEYVIVDKQDKISSASTIVSQTIYPDLVEDATTNTIYYDCPGFSDTRSAAHEIAATYFIKKVIDSARAVKLVFVVSHNSVTKGADRQDFILMLQHATEFINQIKKFKTSIALVVTKIENRYVENKLVSDEKVIKAIGHYLEQAERDIDEHPEMVTTAGKASDTKEKVLYLLDIFRNRGQNEQNTRIGIFRKPNEPGLLSEIELMKKGKISLKNMINKNIQFVEGNDHDFGYTVSAKSKVHISGLAEEINRTIIKELLNIRNEMEKYCIGEEEKNSELEHLNFIFQKMHESFSRIQDNAIKDIITPEMFINEIDNNIKDLKISIPNHHIETIWKEEGYIYFLNLVSNTSIKNHKSSLLAAGLSNLTEYLSETHSFYSVLNSIYQRLSAFDIQKKRSIYSTIDINTLDDLFKSPIFIDIEDIFKENSGIKKMKLDKRKLILLNRVLDETLKYQLELTSPEIDVLVVKGVNVILSEVSELLSNKSIKFLGVYALHKVFIDETLDLTGREIQMAIVAPVWEIVGNQSIILDGKPGTDYSPQKARNGEWNAEQLHSEKGFDGEPGGPGGPAGNFLGIGKYYINEHCLRISANGGKGGRGQDGGDGSKGSSRWYPYWMNKNGGNGGNGGIGGYGGPKGYIYTIKLGTEFGVVQAKQSAIDGCPGENGRGGNGGNGGRHINIIPYRNSWAESGWTGECGGNACRRSNTWQLKANLIDLSKIRTEYKKYMLSNINDNLQEKFLTKFLVELDNNYTPITQATIWYRGDIIKSLK